MSQALRSRALFLGNLNNELPKLQIAALILQLTHQCTGLTLELKDIKIRFSQPSNCFTATLKLPTPDEQQKALTNIGLCQQVPNGLVKLGRSLKVDVFQKPGRGNAGSQLSRDENSGEELVYVKNQHLGNETRTLEFKEMANLNLPYLRKTVSRYVCAFLNSSGGTLVLGVNDRGNVQGTPLSHKLEDDVRLAIDQIIKNFDPPVLPQMYSVLFIPVRCLEHGDKTQDLDGDEPSLKVIKLVVSPGRPHNLYATPSGDVFIRRDGSVQGPLKPRDIQEWCNMNFVNKEKHYRQQISDLQSKLRKAEYYRQDVASTVGLKKARSAVCTLL